MLILINEEWFDTNDFVPFVTDKGNIVYVGNKYGNSQVYQFNSHEEAIYKLNTIANHINKCKAFEVMMTGVCQDSNVSSEDIIRQYQELSTELSDKKD